MGIRGYDRDRGAALACQKAWRSALFNVLARSARPAILSPVPCIFRRGARFAGVLAIGCDSSASSLSLSEACRASVSLDSATKGASSATSSESLSESLAVWGAGCDHKSRAGRTRVRDERAYLDSPLVSAAASSMRRRLGGAVAICTMCDVSSEESSASESFFRKVGNIQLRCGCDIGAG